MVTGVRRIVLWFMSTVTALVLLFSYSTSTSGPAGVGGATAAVAAGNPVSGGGTASPSAVTVSGPAVSTRWGDLQVEITVDGSAITDVSVPVYPDGNGKDHEINAYALPVLVSETLDAQTADIDMVSGATVTSEGYVQSLQAALDQAGL